MKRVFIATALLASCFLAKAESNPTTETSPTTCFRYSFFCPDATAVTSQCYESACEASEAGFAAYSRTCANHQVEEEEPENEG